MDKVTFDKKLIEKYEVVCIRKEKCTDITNGGCKSIICYSLPDTAPYKIINIREYNSYYIVLAYPDKFEGAPISDLNLSTINDVYNFMNKLLFS